MPSIPLFVDTRVRLRVMPKVSWLSSMPLLTGTLEMATQATRQERYNAKTLKHGTLSEPVIIVIPDIFA